MLALIPIFPLIGFLINGTWYALRQSSGGAKKASSQVTGMIATSLIGLSFLVAVSLFVQLLGMPAEHRMLEQNLFSWISIGDLHLDIALRVDALSTLFTLVITGVGTLIHLYSIGYMSHDESPGKFFAYLNLFCFAMLILVLGASLPMLFLGWEGVGLCSYLLIGYWYTDPEKASAGKKAFIVNRVGDLGFLFGMFLIFSVFHTLDFDVLKAAVEQIPVSASIVTAICLFLFVGCMGKSAQIPLYVWLPDAMAGPTPVSALIHAATMVTSGIYLLARLNFLFRLSPDAMMMIAVIGALTAFFAATIALVQKDIKKILAYSTVSQLGYMFLGCGVGAFDAGVFHVMTHAFFKALLFLGAGSVIHGMHEEQDIWKMGGLRKKMPWTFLTFTVGWLAICGLPPFAGFFSKDEILWQAYHSENGSIWLWAVGAVTAVMTAFYMTRLFSLTFFGKFRGSHHAESHVHESPASMVIPLAVLALLSLVGGWIGIPHLSWLEQWLHPIFATATSHETGVELHSSMEWILMGVSVVGALCGIGYGFKLYQTPSVAQARAQHFSGLYRLLENKWYIDELYEAILIQPIQKFSRFLWRYFDVAFIDRIVLSFAKISARIGLSVRFLQTGSVQIYTLAFLFGLVMTAGYFIYGLV